MAIGKQIALQVPREPMDAIDAFFAQQGITEWTMRAKGGQRTIAGRTEDGGAIRISSYTSKGFRSRTSSSCGGLTPARRKAEAKRMKKAGLTQSEIAEHLGCSQKTISNDLRG